VFAKTDQLAALDGRKKFSMDKALTITSFVLLLIIVVIPVFMIIFNTFFEKATTGTWRLDFSLIKQQLSEPKNLSAMWNTVKIAFLATIIALTATCRYLKPNLPNNIGCDEFIKQIQTEVPSYEEQLRELFTKEEVRSLGTQVAEIADLFSNEISLNDDGSISIEQKLLSVLPKEKIEAVNRNVEKIMEETAIILNGQTPKERKQALAFLEDNMTFMEATLTNKQLSKKEKLNLIAQRLALHVEASAPSEAAIIGAMAILFIWGCRLSFADFEKVDEVVVVSFIIPMLCVAGLGAYALVEKFSDSEMPSQPVYSREEALEKIAKNFNRNSAEYNKQIDSKNPQNNIPESGNMPLFKRNRF